MSKIPPLVLGDLVRIARVDKKNPYFKILIYLGHDDEKTKTKAFKWCKLWHPQTNIELWPEILIKKLDVL